MQLEGSVVQFLLFADDLVLVAENEEDIKKNEEVLNEVMKKMEDEDKLAKDQGDGSTERGWYMPLGGGRCRG